MALLKVSDLFCLDQTPHTVGNRPHVGHQGHLSGPPCVFALLPGLLAVIPGPQCTYVGSVCAALSDIPPLCLLTPPLICPRPK